MKKLCVLFIIFLIGCNKPQSKLDKIDWLIGDWQMKSTEGIFIETWNEKNDSVFSGTGFFINQNGDTAFSEKLKIIYIQDTVYYISTVGNQNEGRSIRFTETDFNGNEFSFENIMHDFPRKIIYTRISDTVFFAELRGLENGLERKEEFRFVRIK